MSAMSEIAALEKHACPACGAQAEWNPAKQKLVCPFCGTESPYHDRSRRPAQIEELDLVKTLREMPDDAARLADRAAHRAVPELQGGDGVRPDARRAELRVLRLAGARRLPGDQGADPAAEPAAVQGRRETSVREQIRRWYASKWLAPGTLKRTRARRHRPRRLHPVLDVRRAGALPVGGRGRALLLHDRDVPRQPGATADAAGAARALGAGRPASSITSSTTSRCRARRACRSDLLRAGRAVSDAASWCPTTRRFSRASSSSTTRSCCSTRRSGRRSRCTQKLEALCAAAGSRRHVPQPARSTRRSRADVQAHPRAGLAADVHLRRRSVPGGRQRLHGDDGRAVPEEPVEDRCSSCCWRSLYWSS